jgi:hypothetical protein
MNMNALREDRIEDRMDKTEKEINLYLLIIAENFTFPPKKGPKVYFIYFFISYVPMLEIMAITQLEYFKIKIKKSSLIKNIIMK